MRGGARKKTAELRCQCRGNSSRRADAVWSSGAWREDTHMHALMHSSSPQIDIIVTAECRNEKGRLRLQSVAVTVNRNRQDDFLRNLQAHFVSEKNREKIKGVFLLIFVSTYTACCIGFWILHNHFMFWCTCTKLLMLWFTLC
jgi:hypothetical protein